MFCGCDLAGFPSDWMQPFVMPMRIMGQEILGPEFKDIKVGVGLQTSVRC